MMMLRQAKGFTLLETMIALVLLGMVLIPAYEMFAVAHLGSALGGRQTTALNLAQDIMEEYRARNLQSLALYDLSRTDSILQPGYAYAVDVTVESTQLNRIEVSVFYEAGNQERTITLVTRMGD